MKFGNPQGFYLAFVAIGIVALYFKKEQKNTVQVSSIKLWDQVLKETEGLRVSKIDKYLLLILQLLIAFSIIMALSEPLFMRSRGAKEITIFLDTSISMRAVENGQSHFQMGKEEIKKYLDVLDDKVSINLVLMKDNWQVVVEGGNKGDIKKSLNKLDCSKEVLNLNEIQDFKGESVFITDKELPLDGQTIKVGRAFDNVGILYGNYDYYTDNIVYRIKNYSTKKQEVFISVVDENGDKVGIQKLKLLPEEEKDENFQIGEELKLAYIVVENEDMLPEDNKYFVPIGDEYKKKILFIGDNFFLEKAIESIPNVSYTKANSLDEDNDCDLYIISKEMEFPLDKKGGVWDLYPDGNLIDGKIEGQIISNSLDMVDIYVEETQSLKAIEGFETVLKVEDNPLCIRGFEDGRKTVYSTIDFKNTNFSLTPYFPIFVEDTLDWFFNGEYRALPQEYENPPSSFVVGQLENVKSANVRTSTKTPVVELKNIFILLAIVFLIIEWKVYSYDTHR